jgi:hypothetical protein
MSVFQEIVDRVRRCGNFVSEQFSDLIAVFHMPMGHRLELENRGGFFGNGVPANCGSGDVNAD